jgi:hypothetical protein
MKDGNVASTNSFKAWVIREVLDRPLSAAFPTAWAGKVAPGSVEPTYRKFHLAL